MGSNDNLSCHSERSKDSVQKLTECQVLDGDSAEEKQLNVAFLRGLSEIQSISVAYSDLNKEILRSLRCLKTCTFWRACIRRRPSG